MEWMSYVVAAVFCILGGLCVVSIIFSLPGAWIMLGLAALIEFIDRLYLKDSPNGPQTFPWRLLGACVALVALSELIKFAAGAAGAKQGGASRRGMLGALIGGIAGAILLTGLMPIVGSLIGAMVGTFLGAGAGEVSGQP